MAEASNMISTQIYDTGLISICTENHKIQFLSLNFQPSRQMLNTLIRKLEQRGKNCQE